MDIKLEIKVEKLLAYFSLLVKERPYRFYSVNHFYLSPYLKFQQWCTKWLSFDTREYQPSVKQDRLSEPVRGPWGRRWQQWLPESGSHTHFCSLNYEESNFYLSLLINLWGIGVGEQITSKLLLWEWSEKSRKSTGGNVHKHHY